MKKSVLGIGNALVDILTRIDNDNILNELGLPKGSMQLVDEKVSAHIGEKLERYESSMSPGGSTANTIHGLAKCGIPAGYICYVGNDRIGGFFEDAMRKVGVQPFVFHSDISSGTSRAIVSPDGERTFATHLGAGAMLNDTLLTQEIFKGWDYCFIEGYLVANRTLVKKTIELAKNAGSKTIIDLASYNVVEENRDFLIEILPDIDMVFANEEEAKSLTNGTPEDALEFISKYCETTVVKIGKKGSLIKRGNEKIAVGSHVVDAIDTTGAGDMYAAGFLAGLINGFTLERCGALGTCLAENVIQVMGAKLKDEQWNAVYTSFPLKPLDDSH